MVISVTSVSVRKSFLEQYSRRGSARRMLMISKASLAQLADIPLRLAAKTIWTKAPREVRQKRKINCPFKPGEVEAGLAPRAGEAEHKTVTFEIKMNKPEKPVRNVLEKN
jgi:hypothetical protein